MTSRFTGRLAPTAIVVGALLLGSVPALAQDAERPEIVWLEQGAGNPYWDAQHAAAAAAGEDLGFDFRAVSGNSDPAQQAATLTQLVDQGAERDHAQRDRPDRDGRGCRLCHRAGRAGHQPLRDRPERDRERHVR